MSSFELRIKKSNVEDEVLEWLGKMQFEYGSSPSQTLAKVAEMLLGNKFICKAYVESEIEKNDTPRKKAAREKKRKERLINS